MELEAKIIQDRAQKSQVLRYAAGKRWFPQLEVDVLPRIATASTDKPLTDIDVLVCIPDEFDGFRLVLIDCKTKKNESPITRALWLRGLMDELKGTRGICIFAKEAIERDHRYSAAQQAVLLLTQDEFAAYANATGAQADGVCSHAADIERWERYFEIGTKYPNLAATVDFSTSGYWMCGTDAAACRKTISEGVRIKSELDPAKGEHFAVVLDLSALFAHSLAKIISKVFAGYLQPKQRDVLADALLTLLYGGREAYEHLNSMKKLIAASSAVTDKPLTLPEWDHFLQLARHALDAPTEINYAPLILRELSWSFLGKQQLDFAKTLAGEKRQAAKLALLCAEYLIKASKYPPEFLSGCSDLLLAIQQVPQPTTALSQ